MPSAEDTLVSWPLYVSVSPGMADALSTPKLRVRTGASVAESTVLPTFSPAFPLLAAALPDAATMVATLMTRAEIQRTRMLTIPSPCQDDPPLLGRQLHHARAAASRPWPYSGSGITRDVDSDVQCESLRLADSRGTDEGDQPDRRDHKPSSATLRPHALLRVPRISLRCTNKTRGPRAVHRQELPSTTSRRQESYRQPAPDTGAT